MAPVNLLPPHLRAGHSGRRHVFYPMVFLVLFSAFAGLYFHFDGMLSQQAEQRLELQTAIAALQPVRLQRETMIRLEGELRAVVNEFERRVTWSVYTDELAAQIPVGVVLRELRMDGQRLVMTAYANSLEQVAQFISNLTASDMYREPAVSQITIGSAQVDFQASVDIIRQKGVVPR